MFALIEDNIFEKMDSMVLKFSTDQDAHSSVDVIVGKLSKCTQLKDLTFVVWENSEVGSFFEKLSEGDFAMYKTLINLKISVHNGVKGADSISKFISKFRSLKKLESFPNEQFNPFKFIDGLRFEQLSVFTPDTQENCQLVTKFINESQPSDLTLKFIQFEAKIYDFDLLENLKHLRLEHLSNVEIGSLLSQIKGLTSLHLNDVGLNEEKFQLL